MTVPLLPEVPFEGAHFRIYQGEHHLPAIVETCASLGSMVTVVDGGVEAPVITAA